jgi:hypothetical protein
MADGAIELAKLPLAYDRFTEGFETADLRIERQPMKDPVAPLLASR